MFLCPLPPPARSRVTNPMCPLNLSPAGDAHLHHWDAPNPKRSCLLDTPSVTAWPGMEAQSGEKKAEKIKTQKPALQKVPFLARQCPGEVKHQLGGEGCQEGGGQGPP